MYAMKNKIAILGIIAVIIGISLAKKANGNVPVGLNPITVQWQGAYETPVFDSLSGKLEDGQYYFDGSLYVGYKGTTTIVSTSTGLIVNYPPKFMSAKVPFSGMQLVHEISKTYYNTYIVDGVKMKNPTVKIEYDKIGGKSLAPQFSTTSAISI